MCKMTYTSYCSSIDNSKSWRHLVSISIMEYYEAAKQCEEAIKVSPRCIVQCKGRCMTV